MRAEKDELLTAAVNEEAGDVEQLGLVPVAIAWLFRLVAAERERVPAAASASAFDPASVAAPTGGAPDATASAPARYVPLFCALHCTASARICIAFSDR